MQEMINSTIAASRIVDDDALRAGLTGPDGPGGPLAFAPGLSRVFFEVGFGGIFFDAGFFLGIDQKASVRRIVVSMLEA